MYRAISRLKKENQHEIPNFPLHLFLINKFSKIEFFFWDFFLGLYKRTEIIKRIIHEVFISMNF